MVNLQHAVLNINVHRIKNYSIYQPAEALNSIFSILTMVDIERPFPSSETLLRYNSLPTNPKEAMEIYDIHVK